MHEKCRKSFLKEEKKVKLTKNAKLKRHNMYFAHVAPQSATIFNAFRFSSSKQKFFEEGFVFTQSLFVFSLWWLTDKACQFDFSLFKRWERVQSAPTHGLISRAKDDERHLRFFLFSSKFWKLSWKRGKQRLISLQKLLLLRVPTNIRYSRWYSKKARLILKYQNLFALFKIQQSNLYGATYGT